MLGLWLAGAAHVLGLFTLWSGDSRLVPFLLVAGYIAILACLVRTALFWRDWFNPLSLALALGLIRFSLPALLLIVGVEPQVDFPAWNRLNFEAGHVLAVTGLLGAVLGWFLVSSRPPTVIQLKVPSKAGVSLAAAGAMAVGFASVLAFIASHTSLSDAILSGSFRGTRIQEGTGIFFYLAHLLISGSAILTAQRLRRVGGGSRYMALLPAMLAVVTLWTLGGRGRALTPLICGALLMWYMRRERQQWKKLSVSTVPILVFTGLPLMAWAGYVGQLYRDGLGIQAFVYSLSISGVWNYFRAAIFTDVGHLYAMAGVVFVGPAVLHGSTFLYSLLWPISQALGLSARNPGVLVVEALNAGGGSKFALATSVVGDAYLNFGVIGLPIVMCIFGAILKATYLRFRQSRLSLPIYVLWVVYAMQIFYGSINAWSYTIVVLGSALLLVRVGQMLLMPRVGPRPVGSLLTAPSRRS